MADRFRLRRRAAEVVAIAATGFLGLAVGAPVLTAAARPATGEAPAPAIAPSPGPALPDGVVATESASTTSTTAPSTTTTSSTSTTSTTTPPVTSAVIPPLVDDGQQSEVGSAEHLDRSRSTRVRAGTVTSGPTLPLTGDSTLTVFVSGFAALAMGALALWWGSRRQPDIDVVDAPRPPARG